MDVSVLISFISAGVDAQFSAAWVNRNRNRNCKCRSGAYFALVRGVL
jgi:hypothetical protein